MSLSSKCVLFAISLILAGCRRPPSSGVSLEDAQRYSSDPQSLVKQTRFGTDWIVTSQGPRQRTTMVDPGDPNEAAPYYSAMEAELDTSLAKFNQMLLLFGYEGLTGQDLEDRDPDTLMDPVALVAAVSRPEFQKTVQAVPLLAGDIVAARFFAPKITDVAVDPDAINLGWRKVVRLRAREGSKAKAKGLSAAWLLFNIFSNSSKPFETKSLNNQAMLIRAEGASLSKPVYWLVFGSVANPDGDGDRIDFLTASFDNRTPDIVPGGKYYVPRAWADCHGGLAGGPNFPRAKLNYLDTDHWFDRTRDDFKRLNSDPALAVVFDGGGDTNSPQFKRAFGVLYGLNQEIKDQNVAVNGSGPKSFQLRAVEKWLELHNSQTGFVDMFDRNLAPVTGGRQWTKTNPIDAQLLPLLNRYCFRCHSSLRYHVFDKDMVYSRRDSMLGRLELPADDMFAMPQDRDLRTLAQRDYNCLIELLPHVGEDTSVLCSQP